MSGTTKRTRDGSNTLRTPPANEALQGDNGTSQAWLNHFQDVANLAGDAWRVGDYKQTIRTDLSQNWLLCDGRTMNDADYPDLAALLKAGSSNPVNTSGGKFMLPTATSAPAGADNAVVQTWVRALP